MLFVFFFFQAEDGIRDLTVTGVQTCALPISQLAEYVSTEAPAGYKVSQRSRSRFTAEGLRIAHEEMGDDFYMVVTLSGEALKRHYGDEKDRIEEITRHQIDGPAFEVVEPVK